MEKDEEEIAKAIAQMREACDRARGYADFFDYPPDRDIAEVGHRIGRSDAVAADPPLRDLENPQRQHERVRFPVRGVLHLVDLE